MPGATRYAERLTKARYALVRAGGYDRPDPPRVPQVFYKHCDATDSACAAAHDICETECGLKEGGWYE